MRDIDTRALFMKEVDAAAEKEKHHNCHDGEHNHQNFSRNQVEMLLPRPQEEGAAGSKCMRCDLVCSHKKVYELEKCKHTFCLLCLYSHFSDSFKDVLKDRGEFGEFPPISSDEVSKFSCPVDDCTSSFSALDVRVNSAVFSQMDLAFPPLAQSLIDSQPIDGIDLQRWKHVKIVDLKKSALHASIGMDEPVALTASIEQMVEQYEEFVRCPNVECGAVFERVLSSEEPPKNLTDDNGKPLRLEALMDYHYNRFRCRRCSTAFCANCGANPYHLGSTCQEIKESGGVLKECRFCQSRLPGSHPSYQELNNVSGFLKQFEPPDKNARIDSWKVEKSVLDSLFNADAPGLSEEEKAQIRQERALYEAMVVQNENPTVVVIELDGIHRYGQKPPQPIKFSFLAAVKEDGTLGLHERDVASGENEVTWTTTSGQQKKLKVTQLISLRNSEMSFELQLFAGEYRFDGSLEAIFEQMPGRTFPLLGSFKGYFVKAKSPKFTGSFCVDLAFEAPTVSGPQFYNCNEQECLDKLDNCCKKIHDCGHLCYGIKDEKVCLPCLEESCIMYGISSSGPSSGGGGELKNVGSDDCQICWIDDLTCAPSVMMECGHVFHYDCVMKRIANDGSPGPISFSAIECPICFQWLKHPTPPILNRFKYFENLKKTVEDLALRHMKMEGLDKHERVTTPGSEFYNEPLKFALHTFDFFTCANCGGAMYGGHHVCGPNEEGEPAAPAAPAAPVAPVAPAAAGAVPPPPPPPGGAGADGAPEGGGNRRLCPTCRSMLSVNGCRFHGGDRTIFKCRFCCAVATYFCGGMCHYCDPCHDKAGDLTDFNGWKTKDASKLPKCPGKDKCPLGIDHPPNGQEFPIGCSVCRERGAMGITSKTFFPIGCWFFDVGGQDVCGRFPPLFGGGIGTQFSKGRKSGSSVTFSTVEGRKITFSLRRGYLQAYVNGDQAQKIHSLTYVKKGREVQLSDDSGLSFSMKKDKKLVAHIQAICFAGKVLTKGFPTTVEFVDNGGDNVQFKLKGRKLKKYVNGTYSRDIASLTYNVNSGDLRDQKSWGGIIPQGERNIVISNLRGIAENSKITLSGFPHFSTLFPVSNDGELAKAEKTIWRNNALEFNNDTHVIISDIPRLTPKEMANKKFGISCSIYLDDGQAGGKVLNLGDADFFVEGGTIKFKVKGQTMSKSYSFPRKKWTRVMFSVDDTECCFGTDVKYIGESAKVNFPNWKAGQAKVGENFTGKIKDLCIWCGDGDFANYDLFHETYKHMIGREEEFKKKEEELSKGKEKA